MSVTDWRSYTKSVFISTISYVEKLQVTSLPPLPPLPQVEDEAEPGLLLPDDVRSVKRNLLCPGRKETATIKAFPWQAFIVK